MHYGEETGTPFVFLRADRLVAARTAAIVSFVAGLWLFVSPWAYYGVSDDGSAWNAWLIGAALVAFGVARSCAPTRMVGFSYVSAILGAWIFVSPWVYQFTSNEGRFINSLSVGAFVCGFSLLSALVVQNRVDISS